MPAGLYVTTYLVVVAILTVWMSLRYSTLSPDKQLNGNCNNSNPIMTLILVSFLVLFIGFRPVSYEFVDMVNYYNWYNHISLKNIEPSWDVDNKIFDNLQRWMSLSNIDIEYFYLLLAAIYFPVMALALKRIFPNDYLYAYIIYLGAFSTFSYGTNGIKAGAAASIFLLALSYYPVSKIKMLFWAAIAYGFHHSMQLPIAAMILCWIIKNRNFYIYFWICCLFMAAAHITFFQTLFGGMTDGHGAEYLLTSAEKTMIKSGFRLDFLIYTSIPVFIGWWVLIKNNAFSRVYDYYFRIYLFISGIWMLCMYASFTNRIAFLAWQILPLVSVYPFFKINLRVPGQYSKLNILVFVYLGFTIIYNLI